MKLIFLFFCLLSSFDVIAEKSNTKILVHGHRGARALRPENTLKAFDYALSVGVDVLELDLAVTKDNHVVVSHDPYIDPVICQYGNGKRIVSKKKSDLIVIRNLSLKQVKEFDCGSLRNPRFPRQKLFPGEKIPTLSEVFELVKSSKYSAAKNVEFNIETKMIPLHPQISPSPKIFSSLINKVIKKHKMSKRIILQSFDYRTLVEMKKLNTEVRLSQLTYESMVDLVAAVKGIGGHISSPNIDWINKKQVEKLHQAGIQVAPWTANTEKEWSRLVDMKVDAIITDDPKGLIDYLKKKKLR